jgi:beta-aspartyl-peptidase (threonine type)
MEFSSPKSRNRYNRRSRLPSRFLPLWIVVLCILCFADRIFGQQPTDENVIRSMLDSQVAAWNQGDVEGYMHGYWDSDSTVFSSGGTMT